MTTHPLLAPEPAEPVASGLVPTFSILIPAYQAAGVVGEALASVFAQTVPPHEVIVCDDASTDDLDAAVAPFRNRIVLVSRATNGGEAAAKNDGARAASGDFVAILDADDVYLPTRLAALGELAATRPDLDILTTDAYLERAGERLRRCYEDDWPFETVDQRRGILERNFVFGLAAVRRERLLAVGGFDETIRWTSRSLCTAFTTRACRRRAPIMCADGCRRCTRLPPISVSRRTSARRCRRPSPHRSGNWPCSSCAARC